MSAALFLILALTAQPPVSRAAAEQLARKGDTHAALHAFEVLADADAADVESRLWIGRLQMRLGHADLAEATFRAVLANRPQDVEALVGLGRALLNQARLDAALEVFERAVALAPADGDALAARGRALSLLGRG